MVKMSWIGSSVCALVGCGDLADRGTVEQSVELDPAICALDAGDFSLDSTNPYYPLDVGLQWIYEGEEDGESIRLQITVLDRTRKVGGVTTRVVEEREWADDELVEISRNYFAEAGDGTVCYFGEAVDIYEDGRVVSHEGEWRADEPGNAPGIIMPADPHPGQTFLMELAPGIAEDTGTIVGTGPVTVPAGSFGDTIRVRETNPIDGDTGYKIYVADVGLVVDGPVELVSY